MCRLALALALLAVACGDATPAAQGPCGPVEELPIQGGTHLVGDQEPPVPYNSTPPTSGWHSSGAVVLGVHDQPLTEPEQVAVLEQGGVVVTHGELPEQDRAALEELVGGEYAERAALTAYDELEPGTVVLTAWGLLQRCDGADPGAVRAFIDEHTQATVEHDH
jgi:hypothetical protein